MDLKHLIPHQRRRESGPALNLQFAVDKTLVPRVGFTPTFTRASGATFVDSDGLVKYAPENLVINSQNFSNNSWLTFGNVRKIRTSTIPDPSGTLSAYEINVGTTSGNGLIYHQYSTAFQASRCTYSVWVRSVSGTSDFAIRNYNGSTSLSSGALTATTTWTRFEFTFTDLIYQFQIAAVSTNAVGNILVWGAQAERSGTARAYIPTFSAALYGPRFDHDPATLVCKGLLMEDQRTNLALSSNSFDNWTKISSSAILLSSVANPEGSLSTWKFVEDSSTSSHYVSRTFTPVSGTTYTVSVWLKAAENNFAFVGLAGGGFPTTFISVNLSTGAVTTALGTPVNAISAAYLNGWWRVAFILTATAALSSIIDIRTSRDGLWANRSYLGNGVNGMYCYGAQVEAGSHASSYIPTVTGTVARSADTCSLGGFFRFCSQIEGTLAVKATTVGPIYMGVVSMIAADRSLCAVNVTRTNATQLRLGVVQGPAFAEAATFNTAVLANAEFKCAVSFKQNDFAGSVNGLATQTDTSGVFPSSPLNLMHIGYNGGQRMYGWISSIQYYRQRLPNSSLQTLSAIVTNTITYNGVQIQYNSSGNGLQTTN